MCTEPEATAVGGVAREMTVVEWSNKLRGDIKKTESELRSFAAKVSRTDDLGDKGECTDQAMLALRDLESSRMRLGKVIQYAGDGVSHFDKKKEDVEVTGDTASE